LAREHRSTGAEGKPGTSDKPSGGLAFNATRGLRFKRDLTHDELSTLCGWQW